MAQSEKVNCFKCRHFYITWDRSFPRGCSAIGFKGREIPSLVVMNASGMACQYFESKDNTKEHQKNR
ncbi:MAG: uracil-DNA glycosylase [Firmicutes bacterium]|nr:uracil-DNA glycosylase [Bacillota bacterium]